MAVPPVPPAPGHQPTRPGHGRSEVDPPFNDQPAGETGVCRVGAARSRGPRGSGCNPAGIATTAKVPRRTDGPGGGAAGNGAVLFQVEGPDGRITTIGSFQLTDGYGYWDGPDPASNGSLTGARIVTTTGAILATASFP